MFDRRFDEPEENPPDESTLPDIQTSTPTEKVPSISEILDTLTNQLSEEHSAEFEELILPVQEESTSVDTEERIEETEKTEEAEETGEEPAENEEIPQLPTFSEEEIEAAKLSSYEDGYQKGLTEGQETAWKEAMDSVEKQQADTLEIIADHLKKLQPVCQQAAETAFSTAVEFSMAVSRKIFPALAEREGLNEIRNLLEKNFHFLKEEPKISIRLHPDMVEPLKKVLAEIVIKESFPGKIAVIKDESIPVGDCKIEWKNGGLERKTEDVLNQAEELLKLYGQTAPTEPPALSEKTGEENG